MSRYTRQDEAKVGTKVKIKIDGNLPIKTGLTKTDLKGNLIGKITYMSSPDNYGIRIYSITNENWSYNFLRENFEVI